LTDLLLERESEVAQLGELIAGAIRGAGGVVLVEGPAGIGKSSLLAHILRQAGERGCTVASARGSELERGFAFGLVRQLYEPLLTGLEADRRVELLEGAAALAAPVFGSLVGDEAGPREEASHAALHGLHWLTVNLTAAGPLAVAVDDAHWGDAPSLRFLAYLANRIEGLPVVLVVCARTAEPGAPTELLDELVTSPTARVVRPAPLSGEAVGELVARAFDAHPDPQFVTACAAATGGNPMLLRELLGALVAEGVAPAAARAGSVRDVAPGSVARHVDRRLRRLPPHATALARAAAVLGEGAPPTAAPQLAGLDGDEAAAAARALAGADILDAMTLGFVHPLVRAAVYAQLSAPQRADAHRRAAAILVEHGADGDAVALQLLAGEPCGDAWAAEVLRSAGRRAHARGAPDVAVTHLRRALAEPVPAADRVELLVELATAEQAASDEAGLGRLHEAMGLADDPSVRAAIALQLGKARLQRGEFGPGAQVLQAALKDLGRHDPELRQRIEGQLLCARVVAPQLRSPELDARLTALFMRRARVSDPVVLASLAVVGVVAFDPARHGAELAERALAAGLSFERDEAAFAAAATVLAAAGRLERARALWDAAIAGARRRGSISGLGMASSLRVLVHLRLGSLAAAEADVREFQRWPDQTPSAARPAQAAALAEILLERGELDAAAGALAEAEGDVESADEGMILWLERLGRVRLAQQRIEEAVIHLRECGRRLEGWGVRNPGMMPWRSNLAVALVAAGEREEALTLAEEEVALARAFGVPRELGMALRAAGLAQGDAEGIELLREAVLVLEASPARLEHARALTDLGAALRRRGRRAIARPPLRAGLDLAQRCAATALARRAHDELVATGARPRRFVLSGLDALTGSERRVAEMAAEGLTNREIAQALFVTEKTVEAHLGHTFRKLDIGSRSQLPAALNGQAVASAGAGSAETYSGGAMSK
jgi:DNA-binding CsgD family transcriptional regulator